MSAITHFKALLFQTHISTTTNTAASANPHHHHHHQTLPTSQAAAPPPPPPSDQENSIPRRKLITTFLTASSLVLTLQSTPSALAQNWGTRSFIREKFFEPGLSPEDAVARIRQTAEGLHDLRHMVDTMSWRYVIFYIRLKQSYLSQDMKTAMQMVPENRRQSYVEAANELVDNMAEFDYYVRTPKVYESYVYYEKTLKSIDNVVALLA